MFWILKTKENAQEQMGEGDLLDRKAINRVKGSLLKNGGSESPHYNSLYIDKNGIHHMTSKPLQIAFKWLIHTLFLPYYFSITADNTLWCCYC